jgi:hypothetical protein
MFCRPTGLMLVSLLMLAGCFKQATDETPARSRARFTGTEPWTIDGVRPGQNFEEVKQLLGEPREIRGHTGPRTAFWAGRNTAVTFDQAGLVTEVMGSTVAAGDQTLFRAGATEAEVTAILGPGEIQKSTRPKGGGIISLGREHTGTALIYDRDGVRFEFPVFGEGTGHFLARRKL